MDFLPWTIFDRYGVNRGVCFMTCAEQYRIMAFAQLTYLSDGLLRKRRREDLKILRVTEVKLADKPGSVVDSHSSRRIVT
jgi:hypothetical protein